MKITNIQVRNFRLLEDFNLDVEDQLSLVVGKNNTGKTSLLTLLDKFLNSADRPSFSVNDFNLNLKERLKIIFEGPKILEDNFEEVGIELRIVIQFTENDNLSNISRLLMDLDPENNYLVLGFDYKLSYQNYLEVRGDFESYNQEEISKNEQDETYEIAGFDAFWNTLDIKGFSYKSKSILYNLEENKIDEDSFIDLKSEKISLKNVINFKSISARRDVSNKEKDSTLSGQTSKIYKRTESSSDQNEAIERFKTKLIDTDKELSTIYSSLFNEIIEKVRVFGGLKESDSTILINSTLQHRELLEGNTTVQYLHNETTLPEHYNGLGYMNLISMIFEIEYIIQDFKRTAEEIPADINLLFIEEPEAHTHPQMQYVFIRNIKKLLEGGVEKGEIKRDLQYIISTHSAHIVSESDYDDIKYLKKAGENKVISKNLKNLQNEYSASDEEKRNYRFLKQYLTINRSELFFADKAVLIEGDTERIILPAMMKKIDLETAENPLLSQNISIVEVGAHSQIFEKFIDFIGIDKVLIITDIDSVKPVEGENGVVRKTCAVADGEFTSNNSLKFFFGQDSLVDYLNKSLGQRLLAKNKETGQWEVKDNGTILIAYQTEENGYYPRSFEDAFFNVNGDYIFSEDNSFPSLKTTYLKMFEDEEIDVFEFSNKAISSKSSFSIEILINSNNNIDNWVIPTYIREGLEWLKQ